MSRIRWLIFGDISKIFLTMSVLLTATPARGSPIPWYKDLAEASRVASTSQKPLIIIVGAKWCSYCEQMKQQTLSDPTVFEKVTQNFVPVLIDADERPDQVRQLNAYQLPTIIIMSSDAKLLSQTTGFHSASQLVALLVQYRPARSTSQLPTTHNSFLKSHSVRRSPISRSPVDGGTKRPDSIAGNPPKTPLERQLALNRTNKPSTPSRKTSFLRAHSLPPQPKNPTNAFAWSAREKVSWGTSPYASAWLSNPFPSYHAIHSIPRSQPVASSFLRAHSVPTLQPPDQVLKAAAEATQRPTTLGTP